MKLLIGDIVAGALETGELLPRETGIAERFEVSRGVAREAIRGLEERGMVAVTHGRGAVVQPPHGWDRFDPDVLAALLGGEQRLGVLDDYLECRRILEVEAAGLAAERADADDLAALSDAFAEMMECAERARVNPAFEGRYQEADVRFHRALVRATGNDALARMTEPIHRALAMTLELHARPLRRFERGLPEHQRILTAVASRDAEGARVAMGKHLETVSGYLRELQTPPMPPRRRVRT